jgi:hypothetical protein
MNTQTVRRHVKPQPRANTSQTSPPSLPLPLPTNFDRESLLHPFPKPPTSAGGSKRIINLEGFA